MGQQQLLLLVLATVIVGLATVAGIQAFNENQAQASQDALVQRATSVTSDIKGLQGKPTQLGGIDLTDSNNSYSGNDIAEALGLSANPFEAQGAGTGATCTITNVSTGTSGSADVQCEGPDAPQGVTVTFTPGADPEISTTFDPSLTVGAVSTL